MSGQRNVPSFNRLREVLVTVPPVSGERHQIEASIDPGDPGGLSTDEAAVVNSGPNRDQGPTTEPALTDTPQPIRSTLPAKPGKKKAAVRTATYRLPDDMLEALRVIAQYNNLKQGDIVAESVFLHLQNFRWPPGVEADRLRERFKALF